MWKETWMIMIIASIIIPFCTITCHRGFHSFLLYSDISLIIFYANDTSAFFFTHFIHLSLALQLAMINQVTFLRNYLTPLPFRVSIFSLSFSLRWSPPGNNLFKFLPSLASSSYQLIHKLQASSYFPAQAKTQSFPSVSLSFSSKKRDEEGWMDEWMGKKKRKKGGEERNKVSWVRMSHHHLRWH